MTDAAFFAGLVPDLVPLAKAHRERCERAGLHLVFLCGARTWAEQIALFEKGRTRTAGGWIVTDKKLIVTHAHPDDSAHCHGAAYDAAPLDQHEKIDWTRTDLFEAAAKLAPLGLVWGGTFSGLKDLDHWELPSFRKYPIVMERAPQGSLL